MKQVFCFVILSVLILSGCKLGPNYVRPPIPVPQTWREPVPMDRSLANLPWWDLFKDPQLEELIRIALEENKDLKIAVERIEEARAFYGFQKADLYPRVDLNASAGQGELSEDGAIQLPEGTDRTSSLFRLNGSVFWELDFFGRIRRATEAEYALLMSTEEARRFAVMTLVADVATAYIELRELDLNLEISRNTLISREESVRLAKLRFEGGLTSELDWRQAEAEYYRTLAIVQDFEQLDVQKENEISVLLGRNPSQILRGRELDEQPLPPEIPAGLPSALLERRPDVAQAEQILISSNARIGEAKALLFPTISLTGFFGGESRDLDDLLTGSARSWSIAGNLLQPIFNAGKNKQRVNITESQYRQTLYAYESVILQAFREVDDSLIEYQKSGERRISQAARVEAERKALKIAEVRYVGGVSDYLEVLDSQRSLFDAELDAAESIREQLVAVVRLYKALGGGWNTPDPAGSPATNVDSK